MGSYTSQIGAAQIGLAWIGTVQSGPVVETNAQVALSDLEMVASTNPNANTALSAGEFIVATQPQAQVAASYFEIIIATAPPPPPVPGQPSGVSGGALPEVVEHAKGSCRKVNRFDVLLELEALRYRQIKFPPITGSMPKNYSMMLPWDDTFGAYPQQSIPFQRLQGITTPAPAAGDVQILSIRVPSGYDGLLSGFFFQYSGQGFIQGSGDIIFRIQCNEYFVKDLSNVPYLLGSGKEPIPMTQGKVVFSDSVLRVLVNVPNLSGMIQVGQSTVSAGLIGFFWPR